MPYRYLLQIDVEVPMSRVCKSLILSFLAVLVLGQVGSAQPPGQVSEKDLTAKIDKLLSDVYKPGPPGAAVLVKKQGKVIWPKGYGLANLELNVPVEPDMIFRLGSLTQHVPDIAVLELP